MADKTVDFERVTRWRAVVVSAPDLIGDEVSPEKAVQNPCCRQVDGQHRVLLENQIHGFSEVSLSELTDFRGFDRDRCQVTAIVNSSAAESQGACEHDLARR